MNNPPLIMPPMPAAPTGSDGRLGLARDAFLAYRTRCFWHLAPDFTVTEETLPIIVAGLRAQGDRAAFQIAARLCP